MSDHALGVLPDEVSRNPRAGSWLVFIDLTPGADVQAWLQHVATPAVDMLVSPQDSLGVAASCSVGFGATLFDKAGTGALRPRGLAATLPSEVPTGGSHDIVFYVFAVSDAVVATFLRSLNTGGSLGRLTIERGYQRTDNREVFGQLDGLRNIPPQSRPTVAFLGDNQPDEPVWATGGSYLAYLKISQNVPAWTALPPDEQAQLIGRRLDGSRLDLPPGTDPKTEPPFADSGVPAACAHIRKTGPRGPQQDPVQIFRRGTPFIECDANGTLIEGLQFVSYQASIDDFLAILQRWMLNRNPPTTAAGVDSLVGRGLISFLKGGLYFAMPHDNRFIGAGMFDTAGGVAIRVTVVDAAGAPDPTASLEGAAFQISNADGTVLANLTSDAAGHATSGTLPVGVAMTVRETNPPAGAQANPGPNPQTVTVDRCRKAALTFTNTRTSIAGGYGS